MSTHILAGQETQEAVEDGIEELTSRFITNDYLFLILKEKLFLHLQVFWMVTTITILSGGVAFGLQGLAGVKFGVTGENFFNTIAALLETVIPPSFFLLYLLIPKSIVDLFNTLNANGVIGNCCHEHPNMTTYKDFQKCLVTWANKSWWTWIILFVIVSYWFVQYGLFSSRNEYLWLSISQNAIFSLVMYTVYFCLVRIIVTLIFTNWLFNMFDINVNPLHPDGSGGLGELSRILWLSSRVMFLVGLGLSLVFLPDEGGILSGLDIILIGTVYLILIPSLLIGWLWLPHKAMVKYRDASLLRWANEFKKVEQSIKPEDDIEILEKNSAKLKTLKERYELLRDNSPTWPLQFVSLRRLILTFTLPPIIQLFLPSIIPVLKYLYAYFPK